MKHRDRLMIFLAALSAAVLAAGLFTGPVAVGPGDLFSDSSGPGAVFWKLRLPRVLLIYLAGAALSVAGAVFQAMFRNVLATPFTLGVSSGAALGAVFYFKFAGFALFVQIAGSTGAAFAGAAASIYIVYLLGGRGESTFSMLLAGIILNFFCSSLILLLQYISGVHEVFRISRWLMGSAAGASGEAVAWVAFMLAVVFVTVMYFSKALNLLSVSDEVALSRGVEVSFVRTVLFFATSFLVAVVVSQCGIISFVGIIVPCICRILAGEDHRFLMPSVLLFGGAFLTLCDIVSRTVISPAEIPVGIITALLGGPYFLWLMKAAPEWRVER